MVYVYPISGQNIQFKSREGTLKKLDSLGLEVGTKFPQIIRYVNFYQIKNSGSPKIEWPKNLTNHNFVLGKSLSKRLMMDCMTHFQGKYLLLNNNNL